MGIRYPIRYGVMMVKVKLGKNVNVNPMAVTLAGTKVQGKDNFMALAWVTRVNYDPPLLAAGMNKRHYTTEGVRESKAFSVNFPTVELLVKTDYCGIVSGRHVDKSGVFEVFYGELETVPMIKECTLSIECKLFDIYDKTPTNAIVIGEIVEAYAEKQYLTNGRLDMKKTNPLLLTMPDNNYWSIGEVVGKAWNAGKALKK